MSKRVVRVLFICMGNICRSPTAEGVFRHAVVAAGLEQKILVDSAGTHDYHLGHPPDRRTQLAAAQRGYDLAGLRARQVTGKDFVEFDYIVAMDLDNLSELRRLAPAQHHGKLSLFTQYSSARRGDEVPDPYYGGTQGFERVLDMAEDAAAGLLQYIKQKLGS
ncbi:MAG TPA: low molecular weight protein-tyrosine-phosphatase [Pseudoxanthomonas sp.]|nr:low molecular weight protein-tyrosine-phosphatase [Pseudoxanthomonas sp.]